MFGNDTYNEDIKAFNLIDSNAADKLLSTENVAIIYIGRGSCPFCRKFAKKLSGLSSRINAPIHYVDSEDFSDDGIQAFREKYNVRTVPGFIVKKQGELEVRCDSSLPEEEILNLAN
ncbi:MAG: thiol reductase thioredoxin [Clostridium sp.]